MRQQSLVALPEAVVPFAFAERDERVGIEALALGSDGGRIDAGFTRGARCLGLRGRQRIPAESASSFSVKNPAWPLRTLSMGRETPVRVSVAVQS